MSDDPSILADPRMPTVVVRWRDGVVEQSADELVVEEPLEIRIRGRGISVTMRTPGHDDELVAGFLLTEGVITSARDILQITPCSRNEVGNIVQAQLAPEVQIDFERLTRHVFASSSCGLCGKATIDALAQRLAPVKSRVHFTVELIAAMPERMRAAQTEFQRTGGLHAAALFDEHGDLLVLREDVGRHNAVDKVVGWALLDNALPLDRHVLLVSGRSSFEIMQKSLAAGIPIVAAVSAPSSLAVKCAEAAGQTLIGFLRDRRMNIYSHADRISSEPLLSSDRES
jgi:FdhD protein